MLLPTSIASQLAAPDLFPLFIEPPQPSASPLCRPHLAAGWVLNEDRPLHELPETSIRLFAAAGTCECAYDVRPTGGGDFSAPAPKSHGPKSLPRTFHLSSERRLLRVVAPEQAMPGVNWAVGLDGLRVLEATTPSRLDWLLSIDAEEEEDFVERIQCGVRGEAFRRGEGSSSELRIERIESGTAIVLPEACRVAAATEGVLPEDVEVLWRVAPSSRRQPTQMERSFGGGPISRPYWITAATPADARLLARSLPPGSIWAAHLRKRALPAAEDVAMLRAAGCNGLALPWSGELENALSSEGDGAWAGAAGVELAPTS